MMPAHPVGVTEMPAMQDFVVVRRLVEMQMKLLALQNLLVTIPPRHQEAALLLPTEKKVLAVAPHLGSCLLEDVAALLLLLLLLLREKEVLAVAPLASFLPEDVRHHSLLQVHWAGVAEDPPLHHGKHSMDLQLAVVDMGGLVEEVAGVGTQVRPIFQPRAAHAAKGTTNDGSVSYGARFLLCQPQIHPPAGRLQQCQRL